MDDRSTLSGKDDDGSLSILSGTTYAGGNEGASGKPSSPIHRLIRGLRNRVAGSTIEEDDGDSQMDTNLDEQQALILDYRAYRTLEEIYGTEQKWPRRISKMNQDDKSRLFGESYPWHRSSKLSSSPNGPKLHLIDGQVQAFEEKDLPWPYPLKRSLLEDFARYAFTYNEVLGDHDYWGIWDTQSDRGRNEAVWTAALIRQLRPVIEGLKAELGTQKTLHEVTTGSPNQQMSSIWKPRDFQKCGHPVFNTCFALLASGGHDGPDLAALNSAIDVSEGFMATLLEKRRLLRVQAMDGMESLLCHWPNIQGNKSNIHQYTTLIKTECTKISIGMHASTSDPGTSKNIKAASRGEIYKTLNHLMNQLQKFPDKPNLWNALEDNSQATSTLLRLSTQLASIS